ncbi:MAG TPA: pilus assembly protein [Rhodospirillales bacterium]|nr:pilus assembly protein [Rhodospirillales bacterium]
MTGKTVPRADRPHGSFFKCLRGATAVEFALVAPIFLVFLLGTIETGRALWIKSSMQFAVEETTRFAMVNTGATTAALESMAQTKVPGLSMAPDITFTATPSSSGGKDYMKVSASYDFNAVVPLVNVLTITLTASSRVPLN